MATLLSYALTTLADVKETLGIASSDTSKDNLIIRKINLATEIIEGFCGLTYGHHFAQTTYTNEEFDATGTNQLVLRMKPVTTLSSLGRRDTSQNEDDWTTYDTEDYFLDDASGVIDLGFTASGSWNRFRATYTAGYATIPADLAEAAATLAAYMVNNATTGVGVKRISEGQRSIEYQQQDQETSLLEALGLDNVLSRYVMEPILDNV